MYTCKHIANSDIKDVSVIMRGVAIIAIVLHNWLHWCGFARENEYVFDINNSINFWNGLGVDGVFHSIADMISFIGWIGVWVFVFLSGYGLEKKYGSSDVNVGLYLWKQWKKLFFLMIGGVLFFVIWNWSDGGMKYLWSLTLLANLIDEQLLPIGAYWYFGLAFELYVFWLIIRKSDIRWLIVIGVVLLALEVLMIDSEWLSYIRHNFFGWGYVFIIGMIAARYMKILNVKWWISAIIVVLGVIMLFLCNFEKYCWLIFLPLLSVVVTWSMADLIVRWSVGKDVGLWIGKMSAFLFACHPIVRQLLLDESMGNFNWLLKCVVYLIAATFLSILYEKVYRKIV